MRSRVQWQRREQMVVVFPRRCCFCCFFFLLCARFVCGSAQSRNDTLGELITSIVQKHRYYGWRAMVDRVVWLARHLYERWFAATPCSLSLPLFEEESLKSSLFDIETPLSFHPFHSHHDHMSSSLFVTCCRGECVHNKSKRLYIHREFHGSM